MMRADKYLLAPDCGRLKLAFNHLLLLRFKQAPVWGWSEKQIKRNVNVPSRVSSKFDELFIYAAVESRWYCTFLFQLMRKEKQIINPLWFRKLIQLNSPSLIRTGAHPSIKFPMNEIKYMLIDSIIRSWTNGGLESQNRSNFNLCRLAANPLRDRPN